MHYKRIIFNMNHIYLLITLGCYVCLSFAELEPSNQNMSHYACNTKCISKESVDLKQCLSDTGETSDCTAKQVGEVVPATACDYTKTINSSAEELNELFNKGRFTAYKWNTIRDALTKGPVSFQYISEGKDGTVSNIEVIADTESIKFQCQYNFEVVQDTSKSEVVHYNTVIEGNGTEWHWGWYYHSENVHIFRSCQVSPPDLPPTESYATIIVFIREDHQEEGNDALEELTFLDDVKFDNTIVQCV